MQHRTTWLPFAILLVTACGNEKSSPPETTPYICDAGELTLDDHGITFVEACPGMSLRLLPRVRIGSQWHGGQPEDCSFETKTIRCPTHAGSVIATLQGHEVNIAFEAEAEVNVEGFALMGRATLQGAKGFLSNGFQSWSQSGVISLGEPPSEDELNHALAAREDREVLRAGTELSWWYSFAGGDQRNLFAGALTADVFRSYVQIHRHDGENLVVKLLSGGAGEFVPVSPGQTLEGERWQIGLSHDLDAMLLRYGTTLPSRRSSTPVDADAGWNSWYDLWDKVTEQDIRENAPLARAALEGRVPQSALPLRIVIDDGWQQAWGEWEANEKFPSGMDGLASDLKSQGYRVGIWLAPLLVEESSHLTTDHPNWFLQNAMFRHPTQGPMHILDPTQPEAAAHLQDVIHRIVGWGYDFLKIDFLFAGTYEEPRHAPATGMQAYQEALRLIREAAGEDVILLAVGAPSHPSLPHVDAWRLGGDIAFEPMDASWFFIPNQARSVASRWHLCSAVLCDADPPLLRKLPRNEVEVGTWVASLAGGALFLSDDLRKLDQERIGWLGDVPLDLAVTGKAIRPLDPFPSNLPAFLTNPVADVISNRSDHVVPSAWDLPDSRLLINFTDEDTTLFDTNVASRSARLDR